MRKFDKIYKEKLDESQQQHDTKVLYDFKRVYNTLLEVYDIISVHDLSEKKQTAFLTEINHYWNEGIGLTEKGRIFLNKKMSIMTENSTINQKRNYFKSKTKNIVTETLRQTDTKYRIYDIIDKMYKEIKANNISDVLTPSMITNTIKESFEEVLNDFTYEILNELRESEKYNSKNEVS